MRCVKTFCIYIYQIVVAFGAQISGLWWSPLFQPALRSRPAFYCLYSCAGATPFILFFAPCLVWVWVMLMLLLQQQQQWVLQLLLLPCCFILHFYEHWQCRVLLVVLMLLVCASGAINCLYGSLGFGAIWDHNLHVCVCVCVFCSCVAVSVCEENKFSLDVLENLLSVDNSAFSGFSGKGSNNKWTVFVCSHI